MERGVRRWLVNISTWDPSEERFASLASLLPPHERPAITRFVKVDDKKRALVSRLLQYALVREVLGIPFDKITMSRTIEGKPYLASIAKGHPREAVETYRQTLMEVDFEEEEFQCTLQLPEHGFTSFTVDQLVPKENE